MTIKVGMTVATIKACAALSAKGTEDLQESAKGTVLSIEGETALVALKDGGEHVYLKASVLKGMKGRPLKAESLVRALASHRKASSEASAEAPAVAEVA